MSNPIEAPERVQHTEKPASHGDNLNRTELYNAMGTKPSNMGGKANDRAAAGGKGESGVIDFSKAPDIYGGKGDSPVQQVGLSGDHKTQSPTDAAVPKAPPTDNSVTQAPEGKYGVPKEQTPAPAIKDGVIKPNTAEKGSVMSPQEMQNQKDRGGPQTDSTGRQEIKAPVANDNQLPNHQVLSQQTNGKTTDVSSYSGADNKLTNYKLNENGDVTSRATTDLGTNKTDTVKFGSDGRAVSRQVSEPGKPTQDLPVDPKEQVISSVGQDGKVQSIDTTNPDGSSHINLNSDGKPVSIDTEKQGSDFSSTKVHENLDGKGTPTSTVTKNYDASGRLSSDETNNGTDKVKTTYDSNRGISQIDKHTPTSNTSDKFSPTGTATAYRGPDGRQITDVKNNDGSTFHHDDNPGAHTDETKITAKDGSTFETKETDLYQTARARDGVTKDWAQKRINKANGTVERQYGGEGWGPTTSVEHSI
jgi:hypothetical protein